MLYLKILRKQPQRIVKMVPDYLDPKKSFQGLIMTLQNYWAQQGCTILQPYDMEMGAATFHPATILRALGKKNWKAAFVQPCRRPTDGRYGENPNRLQRYYQFQVVLKPSPFDMQNLYLGSLKAVGIDTSMHDIRFVEDDWESPTLGAWGLGWECWCDGMEVSQFTYFQQVCGIECAPVTGEITYGLERLAMYLQEIDNVYNLNYNGAKGKEKVLYGDVFLRFEKESSIYNFEIANTQNLLIQFKEARSECANILDSCADKKSYCVYPAYEQCIKASHIFNLLQARGVLSVAARQEYILQIRELAYKCAKAFLDSEETINNL